MPPSLNKGDDIFSDSQAAAPIDFASISAAGVNFNITSISFTARLRALRPPRESRRSGRDDAAYAGAAAISNTSGTLDAPLFHDGRAAP